MDRSGLTRRLFLARGSGLLAALALGRPALAAPAGDGSPLYAASVRIEDGRFGVALFDEAGTIHRLDPLPGRGHDVAIDPVNGRCVAFARRPGDFAAVFSPVDRSAPTIIPAAPGRHFYGHGVFSSDGRLLYTTENDDVAGRGVVGVYEADNGFRRLGEFETGGVGPHELVWCADGQTLAVANGGLDTSADFGRIDLNRADMTSSLAFIAAVDGARVGDSLLPPALAALSIRHLVLTADGRLWFGCQHQGDPTELPPLVGRLDPGGTPELFDLPEDIRARSRNYIGSVALSGDGATVAVSAPRGGMIFAFDGPSGRYRGAVDLDDGCGIAPAGDGLIATAGTGRVAHLATGGTVGIEPRGRAALSFDNHIAVLG